VLDAGAGAGTSDGAAAAGALRDVPAIAAAALAVVSQRWLAHREAVAAAVVGGAGAAAGSGGSSIVSTAAGASHGGAAAGSVRGLQRGRSGSGSGSSRSLRDGGGSGGSGGGSFGSSSGVGLLPLPPALRGQHVAPSPLSRRPAAGSDATALHAATCGIVAALERVVSVQGGRIRSAARLGLGASAAAAAGSAPSTPRSPLAPRASFMGSPVAGGGGAGSAAASGADWRVLPPCLASAITVRMSQLLSPPSAIAPPVTAPLLPPGRGSTATPTARSGAGSSASTLSSRGSFMGVAAGGGGSPASPTSHHMDWLQGMDAGGGHPARHVWTCWLGFDADPAALIASPALAAAVLAALRATASVPGSVFVQLCARIADACAAPAGGTTATPATTKGAPSALAALVPGVSTVSLAAAFFRCAAAPALVALIRHAITRANAPLLAVCLRTALAVARVWADIDGAGSVDSSGVLSSGDSWCADPASTVEMLWRLQRSADAGVGPPARAEANPAAGIVAHSIDAMLDLFFAAACAVEHCISSGSVVYRSCAQVGCQAMVWSLPAVAWSVPSRPGVLALFAPLSTRLRVGRRLLFALLHDAPQRASPDTSGRLLTEATLRVSYSHFPAGVRFGVAMAKLVWLHRSAGAHGLVTAAGAPTFTQAGVRAQPPAAGDLAVAWLPPRHQRRCGGDGVAWRTTLRSEPVSRLLALGLDAAAVMASRLWLQAEGAHHPLAAPLRAWDCAKVAGTYMAPLPRLPLTTTWQPALARAVVRVQAVALGDEYAGALAGTQAAATVARARVKDAIWGVLSVLQRHRNVKLSDDRRLHLAYDGASLHTVAEPQPTPPPLAPPSTPTAAGAGGSSAAPSATSSSSSPATGGSSSALGSASGFAPPASGLGGSWSKVAQLWLACLASPVSAATATRSPAPSPSLASPPVTATPDDPFGLAFVAAPSPPPATAAARAGGGMASGAAAGTAPARFGPALVQLRQAGETGGGSGGLTASSSAGMLAGGLRATSGSIASAAGAMDLLSAGIIAPTDADIDGVDADTVTLERSVKRLNRCIGALTLALAAAAGGGGGGWMT
jgi:hypothetical protein